MDDNEKQLISALHGLCAVASSNFPTATHIVVSTSGGQATATVKIPVHLLKKMLATLTTAGGDRG